MSITRTITYVCLIGLMLGTLEGPARKAYRRPKLDIYLTEEYVNWP